MQLKNIRRCVYIYLHIFQTRKHLKKLEQCFLIYLINETYSNVIVFFVYFFSNTFSLFFYSNSFSNSKNHNFSVNKFIKSQIRKIKVKYFVLNLIKFYIHDLK